MVSTGFYSLTTELYGRIYIAVAGCNEGETEGKRARSPAVEPSSEQFLKASAISRDALAAVANGIDGIGNSFEA